MIRVAAISTSVLNATRRPDAQLLAVVMDGSVPKSSTITQRAAALLAVAAVTASQQFVNKK
jgi:hypothetical protein